MSTHCAIRRVTFSRKNWSKFPIISFQGDSDKNVFDALGGSEVQFEKEQAKTKKEKKTKKKKKKSKDKPREPAIQHVQGIFL